MNDSEARGWIETHLETTVFVDAGAGSGKTREMVERIIRLVASGRSSLASIAAITFTDVAAAELRDRVRTRLQEASARLEGFELLDDEEVERCKTAHDDIDSASIQTLHSFAQRILSLYPLQAGLPPRLEPMDEVEASLEFTREWTRFREQLYEDGLGDPGLQAALRMGIALGLEERHLHLVALALHRAWHRLQGWEPAAGEVVDLDLREIAELVRSARDSARDVSRADKAAQAIDANAPVYDAVEEFARDLEGGVHGDSDELRLRIIGFLADKSVPKLSVSNGQAKLWGGREHLEAAKQNLKEAQAKREELVAALRRSCLTTLLAPLRSFVLGYAERRRTSGRLEFHDLLVLARDLLARDRRVREAVGRRFRHLLIDEFQDTDPLQIEIAVLIAGWRDSRTDWEEVDVPPGALFFVGDPKQSIYRFRYADIALYERARHRFGTVAGVRAELTQNFRSGEPIIAFVNEAFEQLFDSTRPAPELGPVVQAGFQGLTAERVEPELAGRSRVRAFGNAVSGRAGEWREMEANAVVAAIGELTSNATRVFDSERKCWRDLELDDIAILIPTRAALRPLERALAEAGIPSRIEAKSLLFGTQEVRDLLNILAAIDDPANEIAVVAALRTPGLACSDQDLFEWRKALWAPPGRDHAVERAWDYTYQALLEAECPPEAEPVQRGMKLLAAFHQERWWLEPAEMVERVIAELRMLQIGFASRRPRDWWQRIRFVHDHARAFGSSGGRSLREFIEWMREQEDEGARAVESAVPEQDDHAVRIMTIHAAKGLEFNVVFVVGLGTRGSNQAAEVLWRPREVGDGPPLEVRVGTQGAYFETAGFAALAEYERVMERLEDDRLLYVAATRARDLLYVSRYHAAANAGHDQRHAEYKCSSAECLDAVLQNTPGAWEDYLPGEPPRLQRVAASPAVPDTAGDYAAWRQERARMVRVLGYTRSISATALAKRDGGADLPPEETQPDGVEREEPPWRRGRAGTSIGRAVHAALQTVDLATGDGLEAAARAQASAEGVSDRGPEVEKLVKTALGSDAVREAVSSGRYWREVPVGVVIDGVTLEGFIDLLYEGPDGLVVVDYKTDAVRSEDEATEKAKGYRLQGAAYVLALTTALGKPVARMVFVFLGSGGEVFERRIDDLAGAIADARRLMATVVPTAVASA